MAARDGRDTPGSPTQRDHAGELRDYLRRKELVRRAFVAEEARRRTPERRTVIIEGPDPDDLSHWGGVMTRHSGRVLGIR
jgi:hypothetical protein